MKYLLLNDLHLGVKRQAGATPESRLRMESWMFRTLESLLDQGDYDHILIAGDLFDKRTVPEHVILRTVEILKNTGKRVILILGNHDEHGRSVTTDNTISSAEMVAALLPDVLLVKGKQENYDGMYLVPHMFNQAVFDQAVENCPGDCYMVCHCNIDSPFAVGDNSLNLSMSQIKTLKEKGVSVIAGHEHVSRELDNVYIPGNQIPTSISDLSSCSKKLFHILDTDTMGLETHKVFTVKSLYKEYSYEELLRGDVADYMFIKISGQCSTEDWPDVLREYTKLRKRSEAFVISNKAEPQAYTVGDVKKEEVTKFNVVDLLIEAIDKEFREDVKNAIEIN